MGTQRDADNQGQGSAARRAAARWAPPLLWMALISVLSHRPDLAAPGGIDIPDKVWHAAIYAVLGALLWRAIRPGRAGLVGALIAIAVGAGYGLADEIHQRLVGRTYDLADWAFDIVGVAVGALLAMLGAALCRRR